MLPLLRWGGRRGASGVGGEGGRSFVSVSVFVRLRRGVISAVLLVLVLVLVLALVRIGVTGVVVGEGLVGGVRLLLWSLPTVSVRRR